MTYQTSKFSISNFQFLKQPKKQQGITLLLAILVLSTVLAISFSIATILFIEIRTSGDLLRTESALYGAEAVAEEALFKIKRKVPPASFTYTTQIGSVDLGGSTPPVESSTTTPIHQDKIPNTFNTFENTTKRYPLFDAANPASGSNYGKIRLTYINSGTNDPLTVYLCEFDPQAVYATPACTDKNSTEYWHLLTLPGNGFKLKPISPIQDFYLDQNKQQELVLINEQATSPIYVQIEAWRYDPSGNYNDSFRQGIPLVGETAVEITAKNSGVTRKIQVMIPNN